MLIFEPYEEALPLEAGFYTFVIDDKGRFRVERGNTSSHAGMVGGQGAGVAGHFQIVRSGKVGRVVCMSRDYQIAVPHEREPIVFYVIDAFHRYPAFEVSPYAVFRFSKSVGENFCVSVNGDLIEDNEKRKRLLDQEGQGTEETGFFSQAVCETFALYRPDSPSRLYGIQSDQIESPIDYDETPSERGSAKPPYRPEDGRLRSGRKAFVIDNQGWLIVGFSHPLLAGGEAVGAAGQIHVVETGAVTDINLNFSGHYRPPLSAEYARFTYRSLIKHPLLSFSPDCRITARKNFAMDRPLVDIRFVPEELIADDPGLDGELFEIEDDE